MQNQDILHRVENFERTVATCLCFVPALFSTQAIVVCLGAPMFERMFQDFGSRLPALTDLAFKTRFLWLAVSLALPIVCMIVSRKKSPSFSVKFSTAAGVLLFLIAQILTYANFLPIMQLGAVAGGS